MHANLDFLKATRQGKRMLLIGFVQLISFPPINSITSWNFKKVQHQLSDTQSMWFQSPSNFLIYAFFSLCMCGMMTTSASPNKRLSVSDHADVLACHICLEVYDERGHEAKFLSCHHSFCSACLAHLAAKTHNYIECPSCRAHTSLTEAGISGK